MASASTTATAGSAIEVLALGAELSDHSETKATCRHANTAMVAYAQHLSAAMLLSTTILIDQLTHFAHSSQLD